jgi:hypothetical protein
MKLLLPPLALFLLASSAPEEIALRYEPDEGTVLTRTFVAEARYHLADMSASIDGEALERPEELPDYKMGFEERITVTDTVRSLSDGHPAELVRTFDELSQESTDSVGEEEATSSLSSHLQGRSVLFRWDDEEERFTAEANEGEELDDAVADWLAEDMDLRLVLPGSEVEVGDEWEVDPKLYLAFMWPSGLLDFQTEDAGEPSEDERASSRQTIERLEGSGTARLEEVRDEDGVRVAVLHVELEITTGSESVLPAVSEDEFERPEIQTEVEIERTLEGTILWDLDHGHALSAELECEASRLHTDSWTVNGEDEEGEEVSADIEQSRLLEGTIKYTATIERQ